MGKVTRSRTKYHAPAARLPQDHDGYDSSGNDDNDDDPARAQADYISVVGGRLAGPRHPAPVAEPGRLPPPPAPPGSLYGGDGGPLDADAFAKRHGGGEAGLMAFINEREQLLKRQQKLTKRMSAAAAKSKPSRARGVTSSSSSSQLQEGGGDDESRSGGRHSNKQARKAARNERRLNFLAKLEASKGVQQEEESAEEDEESEDVSDDDEQNTVTTTTQTPAVARPGKAKKPTSQRGAKANTKSSKLKLKPKSKFSSKKQNTIAKREVKAVKSVMASASFQSDPIQTAQEHIMQFLSEQGAGRRH
ncbi:hypothetical protein Pelo_16510 [Pelomyxa schiedti]|nr:hypothetical protein Pelo_16510 [Pelomyxa schiedti]